MVVQIQQVSRVMKKLKKHPDFKSHQEWFEAQFGKRPSNKPLLELEGILEDRLMAADAAKELYDRCERWEAKLEATQYVWAMAFKLEK